MSDTRYGAVTVYINEALSNSAYEDSAYARAAHSAKSHVVFATGSQVPLVVKGPLYTRSVIRPVVEIGVIVLSQDSLWRTGRAVSVKHPTMLHIMGDKHARQSLYEGGA
jgi:hypothetical protein